jgi:hypothetical protein
MKVKEFKSSPPFENSGNHLETISKVFAERSRYLIVALSVALNLMGSEVSFAQDADEKSEEVMVKSGSYESFKLLIERNIFDPQRRKPIPASQRKQAPPPPPPREESFALVGVFMNGKDKVAFFEGSDREWSGSRKVGESIAGFVLKEIEFSHALLIQKTVKANSDDLGDSTDLTESDPADSTESEVTVSPEKETETKTEEESVSEEEPTPSSAITIPVATAPDGDLEEETFNLMVGQSMRRRGDSPWDLDDSGGGGSRFGSRRSGGIDSATEESSADTDSTTADESSAASSDGGGMSDVLRKMMERRKQEINK